MIEEVVQDAWGNPSSRRVAGFVSLAGLVLAGAAAAYGHPVPDHLIDVLAGLTFGCFGLASADHFAPSAHKEPDAPPAA